MKASTKPTYVVVLDPPKKMQDYNFSAFHVGPFDTVDEADDYGSSHCKETYKVHTIFKPEGPL